LEEVLSLAPTPLANAFVTEDALLQSQPVYPLDVHFCGECTHVQLLDVVDPSVLYRHYVYVSGTSPMFVQHFHDYAADIRARFKVPAGAFVLEIGSNDGTLLRCFRDLGMRVLGIDPAEEITRAAVASGIDAQVGFFTPELAREIATSWGRAAVIAANNVMAHIDDLSSVMEGVSELLADDGVFVFEVSYLADVVGKNLFDTIYHEHLDYHSVKPLVGFFRRHGLELIEAISVGSHGGSLRGVVQHAGGPRSVGVSVEQALQRERELGLDRAETLRAFANGVDAVKCELTELLHDLKRRGWRIAGFGAPAKATTLLYHFGLGPDVIDFIVDDSPMKQGLYSPGMHIPIVPSGELYVRRPDYIVILAWNFVQPIIDKHAALREKGCRFIVPLPRVEVL
jgi:SAM-dependent methyltransferase